MNCTLHTGVDLVLSVFIAPFLPAAAATAAAVPATPRPPPPPPPPPRLAVDTSQMRTVSQRRPLTSVYSLST